jgi:4-amino-4-deoxy-L-arabinose transferase-like glycosyltransferase
MTALALLALLIPISTAFLFICLLWPSRNPIRSNSFFKVCLAVGLGFGIFSCAFLIWLSVFGASAKAFWVIQIAIFILLAAILLREAKAGKYSPLPETGDGPLPGLKFGWVLILVLLIMLVSAILAFAFLSLKFPHGAWDAWAVHNMRARFIFRAGEEWKEAFSSAFAWSSLDYPLLVPLTIVGCWKLVGKDTVLIPAMIALLFTFATIGLASSSLSILRSKSQGLLAGLALLGTPIFIAHGTTQYLDTPLGYFFLATLCLLSLQDHLPDGQKSLLVLAGMSAGFSAWTKNEGLLFVLIIFVSRLVIIGRKQGLKEYVRQMRLFSMGFVPILLVIVYFKARFGAANAFLSAEGQSKLDKLLDGGRYLMILDAFKNEIMVMGGWAVPVMGILALYLLLLGLSEERKNPNAIASLVTLCVMLTGYFFIFVISPFDLKWHLATTLSRLLIQLWPSFIFIFFLLVRTPEEASSRSRNHLSPSAAD